MVLQVTLLLPRLTASTTGTTTTTACSATDNVEEDNDDDLNEAETAGFFSGPFQVL